MLGGLEKALLAVLLIVLMLGMGATLTLDNFKEVLRRPRGILVGICSQFGWMPLLAFLFASALALPAPLALGLIVVGCTPGGTTSNLFAYYAKGDVALAIAMTSVSTAAAVVLMPLLLVLYGTPFQHGEFDFPIKDIITTLLLVLLPVAIGLAVRHRSVRVARALEKLGSVSGVLVLVLLVAFSLVKNSSLFVEIPVSGYLAAAALGIAGMGLGYLAARVVKLRPSERRAVAFETGIQNSPLAFGIIILSFPEDVVGQTLWLPMLYALFVLISASVVTMLFRGRPTELEDPPATPE